jgi:hypothetical protein
VTRLATQLALLAAVFVVVTLIALALGATNLGTAATFGEIAFAGTLTWLLLRR